jgi:hypothetical protein
MSLDRKGASRVGWRRSRRLCDVKDVESGRSLFTYKIKRIEEARGHPNIK